MQFESCGGPYAGVTHKYAFHLVMMVSSLLAHGSVMRFLSLQMMCEEGKEQQMLSPDLDCRES